MANRHLGQIRETEEAEEAEDVYPSYDAPVREEPEPKSTGGSSIRFGEVRD